MRYTNGKLMGVLMFASLGLVPAARADIAAGDLPEDTVWYVHANLKTLRDSDGGSPLYQWFQGEVVVEVDDQLGIDIGKEVDSVTAFANTGSGTVIVVEGPLSQDTRDKVLAFASEQGPVDVRQHGGRDYYFFGEPGSRGSRDDEPFEDLEDSSFVSFALDGKAIVTANELQMQALLDNDGRISGMGSHDGALLILSANKTLVQAGLSTDEMLDDEGGDDWESNILRGTKQAALLVADATGRLAIEAQLVSRDAKMSEAIGGIVNGLIGLQAFNSDLDEEARNLIRNTKVEVRDRVLSISTVIDPAILVDVLND